MEWVISNGAIDQLLYNGRNLIRTWGIETADSSGHFSLEEGKGYRYTLFNHAVQSTATEVRNEMEIKMKESHFILSLYDRLFPEEGRVVRKTVVYFLSDSYLMDFVIRHRFKKEFIERARIADQSIVHKNSNIYYQHPVREVLLDGDPSVRVCITHEVETEQRGTFMYARDDFGEWVVHARVLPLIPAKDVIKLCNAHFGTRPLPQFISDMIVHTPWLRNRLLYKSEKKPSRSFVTKCVNPNLFPMMHFKKDETISFDCEVTIFSS